MIIKMKTSLFQTARLKNRVFFLKSTVVFLRGKCSDGFNHLYIRPRVSLSPWSFRFCLFPAVTQLKTGNSCVFSSTRMLQAPWLFWQIRLYESFIICWWQNGFDGIWIFAETLEGG